jgi:hypothetical protein
MGSLDRYAGSGWRARQAALRAQDAVDHAMNGHYETKPTPYSDPKLRGIDSEEICGVDSMESLYFWFEDSIPALEAAGFTVNKYDVPDWACRVGESGQVLFRYRVAKLVNTEEKNHE